LPPNNRLEDESKGYEEAYEILRNEVTVATQIIREQREQNGHAVGDKYKIITQLEDLNKTNGVVEIQVN
jgi:hypothetical protein